MGWPSGKCAVNLRAARMGPTVWDEEGPIPILKRSNKLIMKARGRLGVKRGGYGA
ncbi:hypothetical protein AA106555_1309 [Neokomagataea thailandica NBRC 106555]|uniref:Transposase n=1 Tax=Neokomagataea thailandica NBRC 106555 TaxID=1223520 RepID=A0ABQ0QQM1_9PROT|nr:hypothetical protein AA106555_1309 [Neokomagataea thailandica NBRC 106555]